MEISALIPAFNEEDNIENSVNAVRSALLKLGGRFEILVADDGSTDGTPEIVRRIAASDPAVRHIRLEKNGGYGRALREGFSAAAYGHIFFTDADGQFDIGQLGELAALAPRADIVCGYRVRKQYSFFRGFASFCYNTLVGLLFHPGVKDVNCAFKLLKREAVLGLGTGASGFFISAELLTRARRRGLSIAETPVSHFPRYAGRSKVRLSHVLGTLREMTAFMLRGRL